MLATYRIPNEASEEVQSASAPRTEIRDGPSIHLRKLIRQTWFRSLCGETPGVMSGHDFLKFCKSIDKSPEDRVFYYLAYKMNAKTKWIFTEKEWVGGMGKLK